uniref:SET domain-containing protein n=1 Tax=viral metagenome TaxID=1070528 RepID=A0A6C0LV62_9ZZZZ
MFRIIYSKTRVCLFTCKKISTGETIIKLDIDHLSNNILTDDYYGRFITHSSTPCCEVDGYLVKATCDIDKNEELTINNTTKNLSVC